MARDPAPSPPRRRILVGDVQGCRAELERLLERLRFDPAADELHPVGDFVNRGPDSAGVLRLCRDVGAGGVLGNHDLHALAASAGRRTPRSRDTLAQLLAAPDAEELLDWLAARPFVRRWEDVLLVHAGLHPLWRDPVEELAGADPRHPSEAARYAVSVRWCDASGRRPESDETDPGPPFRPWFEHPRAPSVGARTVAFGHWSVLGLLVRPGLRGLDTGCVWGRALTAWLPDEDRLVQVDAARAYAPL